MSKRGAILAELLKAGDDLADACQDPFSDGSDRYTLSQRWIELRGEMQHQAHLLLD